MRGATPRADRFSPPNRAGKSGMWITEYTDDPLLWPKSGEGVCVGQRAPRTDLPHTHIVPKIPDTLHAPETWEK